MLAFIENLMRNTKALQKIYYSIPLPLMAVALNLRAYPLSRLRYSKETFKHLDVLMERDTWNREKLRSFVEEQQEIIRKTSESIPFYEKIAKKSSSINDFPILTREEVKRHSSDMVTTNKESLIKVFTSGSSGSGLTVYYNNDTYLLYWAYMMKHKLWANVNPRDWRLTFFGARVVPLERNTTPFWIKNIFDKQYLISIFHISDDNSAHYIKFLEDHQGMVLEGFPTVLYLIARYVKALKGKLEFSAVFSTGEPIYPFMKKEMEEAFGCKVYDSYGMTELGGFIYECEEGGYHVLTDYGSLEIIRENGDRADINEEGYFVWTGFINKAMPFIRYKIGDKGMWKEGECLCGRAYPLVKPTITRDSDYLETPGGKLLSPRAVNQVLKDKVSFKACQFIQISCNEVVVRIVPDNSGEFREDLDNVKKAIKSMMGEGISVDEEIADAPLRRGNQGKIPLIISKTTLDNIRP